MVKRRFAIRKTDGLLRATAYVTADSGWLQAETTETTIQFVDGIATRQTKRPDDYQGRRHPCR